MEVQRLFRRKMQSIKVKSFTNNPQLSKLILAIFKILTNKVIHVHFLNNFREYRREKARDRKLKSLIVSI